MPFKDPIAKREYQARWARESRQKDPEPNRAYQRTRRNYKAAWARRHRADDREASRAYNRSLYHRNPIRARQRSQQYRVENPEKHLAAVRRWKANNPEQVKLARKVTKHKRRAREGKYTIADIRALFAKQEGLCALCSVSLVEYYEVDHVIAIAKGGTNWPNNLQLLCRRCNRKKGAN